MTAPGLSDALAGLSLFSAKPATGTADTTPKAASSSILPEDSSSNITKITAEATSASAPKLPRPMLAIDTHFSAGADEAQEDDVFVDAQPCMDDKSEEGATKPEAAKTEEATKDEKVSKQEVAAKQEAAIKQEDAAKTEEATKEKNTTKREDAAKRGDAAKQEGSAKQEEAAKQEKEVKQNESKGVDTEAEGASIAVTDTGTMTNTPGTKPATDSSVKTQNAECAGYVLAPDEGPFALAACPRPAERPRKLSTHCGAAHAIVASCATPRYCPAHWCGGCKRASGCIPAGTKVAQVSSKVDAGPAVAPAVVPAAATAERAAVDPIAPPVPPKDFNASLALVMSPVDAVGASTTITVAEAAAHNGTTAASTLGATHADGTPALAPANV